MIFSGKDITFINNTLAQIGSFVEQPGTISTPGTVSYSGTSAEAGDPASVTFGTRVSNMRVQNVSQKQVEASSGRYFANDQTISVRGSFSKDDYLSAASETFRPIDGPWKFFMGSNLYWQAVCREVQA